MKKETALKRIKKAVEKECSKENELVKKKLIEFIYLTFVNLEYDEEACHDNGKPYTSTENLKYAISVNLEDEKESLINEIKRSY